MRRTMVILTLLLFLSVSSLTSLAQRRGAELHEFVYEGQTRTYTLHLPPQYDGTTLLPLVLAFHGGGGSALINESMTNFHEAADELGFIVVQPNGSGRMPNVLLTWNGGFCCAYARDENVDDVGFISALIDELLASYAVDADRVYATGHSNGGILSHRLGAELSHKIAAIAPVAAAVGGRPSPNAPLIMPPQPTHPISVLIIHGFDDLNVPYNGGNSAAGVGVEEFRAVSVGESTRFWVEANGCDYFVQRTSDDSGFVHTDRYDCPAGVDVQVITILDAGHSWPGGDPSPREAADAPSLHLDATRTILEFFAAHPRVQ